jgi:hypothetical protein
MHKKQTWTIIAVVTATLIIYLLARYPDIDKTPVAKITNQEDVVTDVETSNAKDVFVQPNTAKVAQNSLPENHSRLQIRFLDVATGYALIPEVVEIQKRGAEASSILRSKKNDIADNGTMEATLPNGTYDISVRKTGYLPMATFFELNNNDLKVNFNLEPFYPRSELSPQYLSSLHRTDALVVVGFVVDDVSGKPLSGVQVQPKDNIVSTRTDENGYFQFLLPLPDVKASIAKRNELLFQKSGFTTEVRKNFDMWPNGDMMLQIRMKKGGGIHEERILLARNASISLMNDAR